MGDLLGRFNGLSLATADITLLSSLHGRQRRSERGIEKLELQAERLRLKITEEGLEIKKREHISLCVLPHYHTTADSRHMSWTERVYSLERDITSIQTIQNYQSILKCISRMVKILREGRTCQALKHIVGPALGLNKDTMELLLRCFCCSHPATFLLHLWLQTELPTWEQ